jgi:hypothetical protein
VEFEFVHKRKVVPFYLFCHPKKFGNLWNFGRVDLSIYKLYSRDKIFKFNFYLGRPTKQHATHSHCAQPGPPVSHPTVSTCTRSSRPLADAFSCHRLLIVSSRRRLALRPRDPTTSSPAIRGNLRCRFPLFLLSFTDRFLPHELCPPPPKSHR